MTPDIWIDRILENKVVESWVEWDRLGLFQQLDILPNLDKRIAEENEFGNLVEEFPARRFHYQTEIKLTNDEYFGQFSERPERRNNIPNLDQDQEGA